MNTATLTRPVDPGHGFTLSRIKEGDMVHAMITLSRQYSRPQEAVIRELATNALESHQEAGCPDPVEITLPCSADPFLTVTDHGLGLGLEDITDVLGDYARSTKRHDGQATPNYGIGSKSPYAVGDSYTVTAVKDGVRREVLFARLADGNPGYKIISAVSTGEANGVSIRVPVLDPATFAQWREAATNVLYWWEENTFLVHDHNPFTGASEHLDLPTFRRDVRHSISVENVLALDGGEWPFGPTTVMVRTGTAGYSVPRGFLDELKLNIRGMDTLVVEMPKDSIKISPNRESIEDTQSNREKIYAVVRAWADTILAAYRARLDSATNSYHLYRVWEGATEAERILSDTVYLGDIRRIYGKTFEITRRFIHYPQGKIRSLETRLSVTHLAEAAKAPCLVLDGLDNRASGIIARWRSAHDKAPVYVFFDKEDVRPLIDPDDLEWVTLADLKAETPARKAKPAAKSLADTDTVDRVGFSYRNRPGVGKHPTTIGELKKLIADGLPLVIGRTKDYNDLADDGGKSIDYSNVVAIACATQAAAHLVEKALGQKASTPEEHRYSLYLQDVEALDDEQKQALVERATLPIRAIHHAAGLTGKSPDLLDALEPLISLQRGLDSMYAQLPGMPEPRLGIEFKHTVALLNELYSPSELLLRMALRADRTAAADRRRRSGRKAAVTK